MIKVFFSSVVGDNQLLNFGGRTLCDQRPLLLPPAQYQGKEASVRRKWAEEFFM